MGGGPPKIPEVKIVVPEAPRVVEMPRILETPNLAEFGEMKPTVPDFLKPAPTLDGIVGPSSPNLSLNPGVRLGGGALLVPETAPMLMPQSFLMDGFVSPVRAAFPSQTFHPTPRALEWQAAKDHFPPPTPERVDALKSNVKNTLEKNGNWLTLLGPGSTFIDRLTYEQLLIFEALLKIDAPKPGEKRSPGSLAWQMKEKGLLDYLFSLSSESQRAFAMLATMSADKGQGYSFAERVYFDYGSSGVLFETVQDPSLGTKRSRLDLALEGYYWMEVADVKGRRDVLNGITGQYFDSYRNKWTTVESPNQWRGTLDEAIRLGQGARENAWRPFHGEALAEADAVFKDESLHPDSLRRDGAIEEYKSTYLSNGKPGAFSFETMSDQMRFRRQVAKYGEAVSQGTIPGIVYRVTAQSIDPRVVQFIQDNIPNVKIIRYDSIADTKGTVVLDQTKKAVVPSSDGWKGAWQRAKEGRNPYLVENGLLRSYLMPEGTSCTVRAGEIKQELQLYTETLLTKNHERLMDRARRQIDWLADLYDGLDTTGRARLEKDITALTNELDRELGQFHTEDAKAKLIAEKIDEVARRVIPREMPVMEEASLGLGSAGTPLDEIPGTFKIYHKGDFGKAGPRDRLTLRTGTRIYVDSLTPDQVAGSFQEGSGPAGGGKKKAAPAASRDQALSFESGEFKPEKNPNLVQKTDANGHVYYEVVKDLTLTNTADQKRFEVKYFGGNPMLELYSSSEKRAGNE